MSTHDIKAKRYCAIFSTVFLLAAVIIEILPVGAMLRFLPSPDEPYIYEYYSYFSLTPYGYAYFTPLFTAVASLLMLATAIFGVFNRYPHRVIYTVLCSLTFFLPIIQTILYFDSITVFSVNISLFLIIGVIFYIICTQYGNNYEV